MLLERLRRRGEVTIQANERGYDLRFVGHGGRAWCSTDEADFYSHLRLGAPRHWTGDGPDLDALVAEAEEATRPVRREPDELRAAIEYRREHRTNGPPLPTYRRWHGWTPGGARWLSASTHRLEYLPGYLRDLEEERTFDAERAAGERRRRQDHARRVLS